MEGEGEREKYHDGFVKFGELPLQQKNRTGGQQVLAVTVPGLEVMNCIDVKLTHANRFSYIVHSKLYKNGMTRT